MRSLGLVIECEKTETTEKKRNNACKKQANTNNKKIIIKLVFFIYLKLNIELI